MKRTIIISLVSLFILSSCAGVFIFYVRYLCPIYKDLYSEDRKFWDFYGYLPTTREYCEFGITGSSTGWNDDLLKYKNDSLHSRFNYGFSISTSELPLVTLKYCYITRNQTTDTIPSIMFYKTSHIEPTIIKKNPFQIQPQNIYGCTYYIILESSESYRQTEEVWVHYEIWIGKHHFKKNVRYSRKWSCDCRPKFSGKFDRTVEEFIDNHPILIENNNFVRWVLGFPPKRK